jgi:hypothetical protein
MTNHYRGELGVVDGGAHIVGGAQARFEGGDAIADPMIVNRGKGIDVASLGLGE